MSQNVNLSITKDEAILLDSCLNALQIIMFNGTSKDESVEVRALLDVTTLKNIQAKIPKFNVVKP